MKDTATDDDTPRQRTNSGSSGSEDPPLRALWALRFAKALSQRKTQREEEESTRDDERQRSEPSNHEDQDYRHHRQDELNDLAKLFRDNIVNEDSNLTLTKAQTNRLKGTGCWKFLDDLTTVHSENRGLTSYLLAAHRKENPCRLQRKEIGRICKAIYDSAQIILYKLDGENDNDLLKDELEKELQDMIAAMQLKSHKLIATCRPPRRGAFSKRASMDTSSKQDATSSAQAANEPPVTVSAAGGGSRRHWSQRDTTRRKSLALKPSAFGSSTGVVGVVPHGNAPADGKDGAAKHPPLTQQHVAVKITRNQQKYKDQSLIEVQILSQLQRACRHRHSLATATTGAGEPRIIAMHEYFLFRNHLCIAFELLGINLYEYLKLRFFQGLPMDNIRGIASQLAVTLALLKAQRVVHCDLKPENVLIRPSAKTTHGSSKAMLPIMQSTAYANAPVGEICLIDFGSSCLESAPVFTYIQSRFYRSPEVILGYPYSTAIDMWSFACILVELCTGHQLFAGENETEQLACIMEICGVPSQEFLSRCKRWKHFFSSSSDTTSSELPERFEPKPFANSRGRKRTLGSRSLVNAIKCDHHADFLAFLKKCFVLDPRHRMTPDQALRDPWIQNHHRAGVDGRDDNSTNSRTNSSISQEITGL
ncbi:Cmgc/dyrk/dyrk2 protein kinase, partial [Globisporangium splendens]